MTGNGLYYTIYKNGDDWGIMYYSWISSKIPSYHHVSFVASPQHFPDFPLIFVQVTRGNDVGIEGAGLRP